MFRAKKTCTITHRIDEGKRGTERRVYALPHTRQTAGPVDYGGGVGAAEGLGAASRSIWPREKVHGFSTTVCTISSCRYGEINGCGYTIKAKI